ncbi:sugar transferase [Acetanaerobacterium elongatum]|uniref:O-antigen biosynthesis protein WbqP n=1 Tax=Acetanaerobacterium elongatum TaxID=258515 RepID=A0A1G9XX14_9FIRM|nr:sugar transferase [Acetanaerobacterium elongatum]SDN01328.1 O-antigen biosynthesis protein WbqP [Acetanaerobacterium elongatum]
MYRFMKRAMDMVLSILALVLLSPLLGILALLIKLDSPGPVLFKQLRVGRDKKLFHIYKYRTMRTDTPKDVPTHLLTSPDAYITKTGAFLRKTSLDELPQLINILRGEMSFVGPRPALYNQDDLVAERDRYNANAVRPGLTGLAQVNGRDELAIPVKAAYDGEYVKKISFVTDTRILFATVGKVAKHEGVVEGAKANARE